MKSIPTVAAVSYTHLDVYKRQEWKHRQVGLLEEQRILTSQYMEISTKYKSLIQTLDEQVCKRVFLHKERVAL